MRIKNLYFQLGVFVSKNHPELAAEILSNHLHAEAIDEDLTNMPFYREALNDYLQAATEEKNIFELRRLFTSAMLRIFTPGVYKQKVKVTTIGKQGFIRQLAPCIGVKEPMASRIVRQSIAYEKVYDDFKNEVDGLVSFLTSKDKVKQAC